MKAEVDKLDINKLVNVTTVLSNLKTNVNDLDIGKLTIVPIDLKTLKRCNEYEVVKKTVCNIVNTNVNNLENKIPDATTLIQINQYNTDEQNLEEKIGETLVV